MEEIIRPDLVIYPFLKYKKYTLLPYVCFKDDPDKQFKRIKDLNSREDNILLCSAIKSGTHWTHEIVCMLVDQTLDHNSRNCTVIDLHLDLMKSHTDIEADKKQRILHSHLPFSFLSSEHIEKRAKIVYLNRNPKDRPYVQAVYPFLKYKKYTLLPYVCFKDDPDKQFKWIKDWNSREDDILLCSAMKSGTHWTHEIVCMLVDQTSDYNSRNCTVNDVHIDSMTSHTGIETDKKQRILHSHLPFSFLPSEHIGKRAKIVFVNRNPKDRHVSQYFFFRGLRGAPKNWSWNDYFEECVINDTSMFGWFMFTREMTNAAFDKSNNIIQLLYEDIINDPVGEISRLAEFLQGPYDRKFIEDIAEKCSFRNLKDHKNDASVVLHPEGKSTIFRKGIIGDWKNWFTVAQNEAFDAMYQGEMKNIDVKFTYEPI